MASAVFAAALGGCLLGPWNLTPQDSQAKVQLEVSCMLVAGRPFDTLKLQRPLSFANAYDSSVAFVDSSATTILVIRTDVAPAETVVYAMSPANTRFWLPQGNGKDTVRMGGRYHLAANVKWDAAREFPQAHQMRLDSLTADTYVQRRYAIRDTALVPIEALHPSLSLGLPVALIASALSDTPVLAALYDSLEIIRSLSRRGITHADFRAYLQGNPVLKPFAKGDTAWYIFDPAKVTDPNPRNPDKLSRYSRQWRFLQDLDPRDFGGIAATYAYDTSSNRILDPLIQALRANFKKEGVDSAGQYQLGHTRFLGITGASDPGTSGYPDTVAWGNRNLAYTGRDVLYFYAVDSLYVEYQRSFNPAFSISLGGGDGGGGGGRNAANLLHYSNIIGGDGYFAAAAVDSFVVQLRALRDTLSVPALHQAWLIEQEQRKARGR